MDIFGTWWTRQDLLHGWTRFEHGGVRKQYLLKNGCFAKRICYKDY